MRIYIVHTYGRRHGLSDGKCEANALASIELGRQLILKGHNPFVPNLWHFLHKGWRDSPEERKYFELVSEWIQFCDAILVGDIPGWEDSGVHREIKVAKKMGKIIYWSLEEVP